MHFISMAISHSFAVTGPDRFAGEMLDVPLAPSWINLTQHDNGLRGHYKLLWNGTRSRPAATFTVAVLQFFQIADEEPCRAAGSVSDRATEMGRVKRHYR